MKPATSFMIAAGVLVCAISPAWANVIVDLKDSSGDVHSTTVAPASFFDVFVELNTDTALSVGVVGLHADASDVFRIDSVTFGPDWSSAPIDVFDPSPETLNAGNSNTSGDIGSIANDLVNGVGPGLSTLVTLHIELLSGAPAGLYTLTLDNLLFGDVAADEVTGESIANYSVNVTPEPAALILSAISLALVPRRRR